MVTAAVYTGSPRSSCSILPAFGLRAGHRRDRRFDHCVFRGDHRVGAKRYQESLRVLDRLQLGYMFLGLGTGAFSAGIFHVMTHAFFKALLFLGAGSVIHALSGEQDLRQMGGLAKKIPITCWTLFCRKHRHREVCRSRQDISVKMKFWWRPTIMRRGCSGSACSRRR